jgi:hypothetical protein
MTAIIAGALTGLLGVLIGFVLQYWQQKWHRQDFKREAYAEFLRSISASFARAGSRKGTSEHTNKDASQHADKDALEDADKNALVDPDLLKATTVVELVANKKVAGAARKLQKQVSDTHEIIRSKGYKGAKTEIDAAEANRQKIIPLFQKDLGLKPPFLVVWWRKLKPGPHEDKTSSEADESDLK